MLSVQKNQTQHKAWSFVDLKEALVNAIHLLTSEPKDEVYFYSRSAFGDVSVLLEYSKKYSSSSDCQANLTKNHQKTDSQLATLLTEENSHLSTCQFFKNITFENSPDLSRMQELLMERLWQLVSHYEAAYYALWTDLDHLGMRENTEGKSTHVVVIIDILNNRN